MEQMTKLFLYSDSLLGQEELDTFVELAIQRSSGENEFQAVKLAHLQAACHGYSPLLFKLEQVITFQELRRRCEMVFEAADRDLELPAKWVSCLCLKDSTYRDTVTLYLLNTVGILTQSNRLLYRLNLYLPNSNECITNLKIYGCSKLVTNVASLLSIDQNIVEALLTRRISEVSVISILDIFL